MATGLLPAVGGPRGEPGVAPTANHLVTVVLLGEDTQRRLNDTTTKTEHLNKIKFEYILKNLSSK